MLRLSAIIDVRRSVHTEKNIVNSLRHYLPDFPHGKRIKSVKLLSWDENHARASLCVCVSMWQTLIKLIASFDAPCRIENDKASSLFSANMNWSERAREVERMSPRLIHNEDLYLYTCIEFLSRRASRSRRREFFSTRRNKWRPMVDCEGARGSRLCSRLTSVQDQPSPSLNWLRTVWDSHHRWHCRWSRKLQEELTGESH